MIIDGEGASNVNGLVVDFITSPVVTAFIGAVLGVTVGARLKGYFEEQGKRAATRSDIENVLKEVALVTQKTKSIEATVTGRLWEDQSRWSRKEGFYVGVIEEIEATIRTAHQVVVLARRELESLHPPPDSEKMVIGALDEFDEHIEKLRTKFAVGRLFVEISAQAAWTELWEKWQTAFPSAHPLKVFEDFGKSQAQRQKEDRQALVKVLPQWIEALRELEESLLIVAERDLKLRTN